MLFRNFGYLPGITGVCLLILSAPCRGGTASTDDAFSVWRDFGTLQLYWLGTGRCPCAEWPDREFDVEDPEAGEAVRAAKVVLMKAFDGYGQDSLAVKRRIPLDVNPQCILGLHLAERFSGTRLGDWGRRQFERCVEQACLVTMPVSGHTRYAELLSADKIQRDPSQMSIFGWAEVPYLYLYLVNAAQSAEARQRARECLALHLRDEYGLGPGFRQCLILLDQGCRVDDTWLELLAQLDQIGPHHLRKKLYRALLKNTNSAEHAKEAFERLARILLLESRQKDIRAALDILSQRFPDVECAIPNIGVFGGHDQASREKTFQQLLRQLDETTEALGTLQLCRRFDAMLTPEEAPQRWQGVVSRAQAGILTRQVARVFLARAMLRADRHDEAEVVVRELTKSPNSLVQGLSTAVLAEIVRVKGDVAESALLYSRAIQTDRPTPLPPWCRDLVPILPLDAGVSMSRLQAQIRFLKGYNDMIDGDFALAADTLGDMASDPGSLPAPLRRVVPCMMMLACLGLGDHVGAEAWGYQALVQYRRDHPEDGGITNLLATACDLDATVSLLVTRIRGRASDIPAAPAIRQQAIHIHHASTNLDSFGSGADAAAVGVQQLYVRAKRHQIARVLMAEYQCAEQQLIGSGITERLLSLEPLLFVSQVLGENTSDQIRKELGSASEKEGSRDRMYRFAKFACTIGRPDLARDALDAAITEQASAPNAEVLEDIADMYVAASNHQQAIEAYKMIVTSSQDPGTAQSAQLRIINICAENLEDYDRAIEECEEFVRRYPDSRQTSHVEFLLGKFAYLKRDYAGAVGQLDRFQRKYPEHPEVGQVMMLAGLSRMAEGDTQEAITRFAEVIRRYPNGDLAARSKFLIGYTQMSEQHYLAALETFKQLVEQFPESRYVAHARSLIDRLDKVSQ